MNLPKTSNLLHLIELKKIENTNNQLLRLYKSVQNNNNNDNNLDELPLIYDTKNYKFLIYINVYIPSLNSEIVILESTHKNKKLINFSPQYILKQYLTGTNNYANNNTNMYDQFKKRLGKEEETVFTLANMVTPNLDYTMWIRYNDLQLEGILKSVIYLTVAQMRTFISQSPYKNHQSKGISDVTTPQDFETLVNMENAAQFFDFVPFLQHLNILKTNRVYVTYKIKLCQ